jgi:hypothetical protein
MTGLTKNTSMIQSPRNQRDMTQFQRRYLTLMLRRSAVLPTFLLLGVSTLELLVVQKLQLPNEQAEVVLEPGTR